MYLGLQVIPHDLQFRLEDRETSPDDLLWPENARRFHVENVPLMLRRDGDEVRLVQGSGLVDAFVAEHALGLVLLDHGDLLGTLVVTEHFHGAAQRELFPLIGREELKLRLVKDDFGVKLVRRNAHGVLGQEQSRK
jgi:hypothetical protein